MGAFRPEVWADSFMDYFRAQIGLADFFTRYDNLAAGVGRGETIKIPALTLSAPGDITPGNDHDLATVTDDTSTLTLDKFRGLPIKVTPTDERFNHPDYRNGLMREAARQIKNDINSLILDLADAAAVTQEVNADGDQVLDADILSVKKYIDDSELPIEDRFLAATPQLENDLLAVSTYINKDFGDGQGQRQVRDVRGFTVLPLPSDRFNKNAGTGAYSCLAAQKMAVAIAFATPHMRLVPKAGSYSDVLEVGVIWGLKILKPKGLVRLLRK